MARRPGMFTLILGETTSPNSYVMNDMTCSFLGIYDMTSIVVPTLVSKFRLHRILVSVLRETSDTARGQKWRGFQVVMFHCSVLFLYLLLIYSIYKGI